MKLIPWYLLRKNKWNEKSISSLGIKKNGRKKLNDKKDDEIRTELVMQRGRPDPCKCCDCIPCGLARVAPLIFTSVNWPPCNFKQIKRHLFPH